LTGPQERGATPSPAAERTVYLDTLGCEKNTVDSEGALGLLLQRGFRVVDTPDDASLVVLNTCGFLDTARRESLDRLQELAAAKHDGQKLVAMGCLVQGETHDLRRSVPGVDAVLGVGSYHQLGDLFEGGEAGPLGSPDEAPYAGYGTRVLMTPSHVAHVKLAEGCNQSCSFCKIPALRGRQRSRPVPSVLEEVHGLVAQGVREVILIAQNSSAYGIDLPGRPRLADLCRALATVPQLRWIRIMYAYPPMFTVKQAREVYDIEKVVDYLDLPIQHASPRVLERMNRGYDPDRLRRQIDELRSIRPDLMLRTTALLGFPGETEEDVVALMDFLDEVRFDHLATFVYSHEQRTSAFHLDDDVDPEDKEDRRARVEALQWDLGLEVKRARLDREVEVMIDEVHADTDEAGLEAVPFEDGADPRGAWTGPVAFGRSEGFCYEIDGGIWMPGEDLSPGDVVRARLVGCGPFDFLAERTTLEGDA